MAASVWFAGVRGFHEKWLSSFAFLITSEPSPFRALYGAAHQGTDYAAPAGTPVMATAHGIVVGIGTEGKYGLQIVIEHKNSVTTRVAHGSKILVKKGDVVNAGDVIMFSGSSGKGEGPHLHYEVIKTHHKRVNDLYWQKGKLDDSNYYKATDLKGLLK